VFRCLITYYQSNQAADLLLEKTLSLTESLCGYDFVLTHMDGRHIRLTSRPGKVTKHEALQVGAHAPYNSFYYCLLLRRSSLLLHTTYIEQVWHYYHHTATFAEVAAAQQLLRVPRLLVLLLHTVMVVAALT
jgi:hypothetical protein